MTAISPVSSGRSELPVDEGANPASDAPLTRSDPFAELAALLVESDFLRSDMDDRNLRAARQAQARAMSAEVRAMRRAADAIVVQAAVQGGTAALGGLAQCTGSLGEIGNPPLENGADQVDRCEHLRRACELRALCQAGGTLGGVAQPLGELSGGTEKAHADADAAEARNDAEQAGFETSELQSHRERVEKHTESLLDLVESTLDSAHQGRLAILAKF